jgi:phenylalanyl-tRNA synthetase beta chain
MRISVNWLQSLVELTLSPEALAELLTIAGLEVEEIEDRRQWAEGVVVGKVLERSPHPNADKLSLCRVDVGAPEPLQIVCGASNVRADIFVPVALVGTTLPCIGLKLKPTKLRGERSEGMICSLAELGLEKTSAGIHLFTDSQLQPGMDVRPLLGLDDVILEISPTANRADALSMVGVAREVSALTGAALTLPSIPSTPVVSSEGLQIKVAVPATCPLYIGTVIEGVTIAPSPSWLQQRLQAAGVRPINNVVDITNYVLLEWGQPLHAFDRERLQALAGSPDLRLGVRFAQAGESLRTLDQQLRSLTSQNLLITVQDQPVAIAGVMGGAETEVHEKTQNIVLESALFDGVTVRRSSKIQNLRSESSTRYERGVNQCELEQALARAIHLMTEIAGGRPTQQSQADARPNLTVPALTLRLERLNAILGPVQTKTGQTVLEGAEVERILTDLGCQLTPLTQAPLTWSVEVPSYRQRDIEREIDLIEEVARLYGYDHFVDQLPPQTLAGGLALVHQQERLVREVFRAVGLTEVVHYSLVKPQGQDVVLANPLLAEYAALRSNLLDGLIDAFAYNLAQGNGALNGFEIGRIFWQDSQGIQEADVIAGILGGDLWPQGRWQQGGKPTPMTWYEAKGLLEQVFTRLGLTVEFQPAHKDSRLHPGRTASLWFKGQALGIFGQLHPQLRQERDLMEAVYGFELRLDSLLAALTSPQTTTPHFQAYSPYPAVERDLALFAPLELAVADLTRVMTKAGGKLLTGVELFDDYRGDAVPLGQRSLAFSLAYRLPDRTLTDEDVEPIHNQIRAALKAEFAVTLRS